MSWASLANDDGVQEYADHKEFHRVNLPPNNTLTVVATEQPLSIWVPAGGEVQIRTPGSGLVLDLSEVVQHEDIVSLDRKLRAMKMEVVEAKHREKRAARRLRRQQGERPSGPPERA